MSETGEKKQKTAVKEEAAEKKQNPAGEEKGQETVIYIGPSIEHVVSTGTVFNNGLPEQLKKEIARQQAVGSLIIPVDRLADAQKELAAGTGALAVLYDRVKTKEDR